MIAYARLTAAEAIKQLQQQGYPDEQVPARAHNGTDLKSDGLPFETSSQSQTKKKSQKQTRFLTTSNPKTGKLTVSESNA